MKVLQILPELNVGGVETGTVDFARYLVNHGHQSFVVSNGGMLVDDLTRNGSVHVPMPVHKKNLFTMMMCVRRLRAFIRKERIDIVHARSRVPAWISYFACRGTQAQFVTTCHGYYSTHFFSRAMGWGKRVIAISQVIARHMVLDFKVPPELVRVIPRSVDLSRFQIERAAKSPSDPKVITMIGRITPLKGHPYFLRAMAHVVRQIPNLKIQIIGDAPPHKRFYLDEILLLTRRLGLEKHVEFLGNRRDIPHLLAHSDCLVLSTITEEAFGRVILEAQAAGVPVVATRVGGVVEIIDHEKTGLLVMPKDVESMAKAVLKVLNDPGLAEKFTEEAQRKIDAQYTIKHMAGATLKVYEEVMDVLNILVIKLTAVGDVILITGALKALRRKYPKAKIQCLTSPAGAAVLQRCPYIDSVIIFDPRQKDLRSIWMMGRELRHHRFDMAVDFQNNRVSHMLAFLTCAKATYGYANGKWSFLLSHTIKDNVPGLAPVPHQFRVLKMLGIEDNDARLELWPSESDRLYAKTLLDSEWLGNAKDVIGINIAASPRWGTKNWPTEHIVKMCDMLGQKNIRVILTGQAKDKAQARAIVGKAKAKPADFTGKTNILQLAALIACCRAYITPDSAPLHVASAMGVPVVALFGPTDPKRHMPPVKKGSVIQHPVECSPCYSGTCKIKTHACMNEIMPEQVAGEVRKAMGAA